MKKILLSVVSVITMLSLVVWLQPQDVFAAEVIIDTTMETANGNTFVSSPGLVWVTDSLGFAFYEDSGGGLSYSSSTDGGGTWKTPTNVDSINTTDVISYGVWWEGWTPGTTTTRYIHIVTTDLGADEAHYTRLDTTTGALTTSVLGSATGASCVEGTSCWPSITMTATGTLYMGLADGGDSAVVRCGQYLSCSTAANWHVLANAFGTAADIGDDPVILTPVAGNDNVNLVYWDVNASTIDWNQYSATSSSWIFGTTQNIVTAVETNGTYDAQFGMAVSTSTGTTALTHSDDANEYTVADHDIKFWTYSSTTGWTAKTNVLTDDTGGVTAAKVAFDELNNTWYVVYARRTTIATASTGRIFYRTSTDNGTTWSAESAGINDSADDVNGMSVNISSSDKIGVTWNEVTTPNDNAMYDLIVDITYTPPAGGGGGGKKQSEFFMGMVPLLDRRAIV
jgi:hypothetical protein